MMKSLKDFILEERAKRENRLGTFDDGHAGYYGPICEMARLGYIPKKNRSQYYEVVVWTDDPGHIPHVHIRDVATMGKEFDCCVKLETPEYFPHGRHRDRFNSQMKKAFVDFINSWNKNDDRIVYETAVRAWNMNNSSAKVEIKRDKNREIIIPDYTQLK